MPDVILRQVPLPDEETADAPPVIAAEEYARRCDNTLDQAGTDWVAVYGDREHSANLLFLTGFDPRFEEGLLLLGPRGQRILLAGNEGIIHAAVAGLPLDVHLFQGFSLMGQSREQTPNLDRVLFDAGLRHGASVGIAGWKYVTRAESAEPGRPAWVPAIVVEAIERIIGSLPLDVTHILMDPASGLRGRNSADQIAVFAWAALRSSQAVFRVLRGLRPGMSERAAAAAMGYAAEPASIHPIVASGAPGEAINGLRSPSGRVIHRGDGVTCGVGYWGALCCRAGIVEDAVSHEFFTRHVRPYFLAQAAWYATIGIGVTGGAVAESVERALAGADATFRPLLNPGHLISYDEWVHSPIVPGDQTPLASGMALQCDIIPAPMPAGTALNCEDSIALADEALRAEIATRHPALWSRVERNRALMADHLGLTLRPEVLPLSLANAYLPPAWLAPDTVCALA
ncbi:MAG: M24 family metallopeptidase [Thermomicrobiales bacterium]